MGGGIQQDFLHVNVSHSHSHFEELGKDVCMFVFFLVLLYE